MQVGGKNCGLRLSAGGLAGIPRWGTLLYASWIFQNSLCYISDLSLASFDHSMNSDGIPPKWAVLAYPGTDFVVCCLQ